MHICRCIDEGFSSTPPTTEQTEILKKEILADPRRYYWRDPSALLQTFGFKESDFPEILEPSSSATPLTTSQTTKGGKGTTAAAKPKAKAAPKASTSKATPEKAAPKAAAKKAATKGKAKK